MRAGRRRAGVLTIGVTAVLAAPGFAAAQSPPYVNWPALLPPLPTPVTPNTAPDCPDGASTCIDRTIVEMQRRFHAVIPRCDHNAVFSLAYLRVTEDVREAVNGGLYQDRPWLQRLDALFARLYFESYDRYTAGQRDAIPASWQVAFDAARDRAVTGLGSFLLSMNAHIQRDFPFVLAAVGLTRPDGTSRKVEHDAYNPRLAALYRPVLKEVADRFDPTADDVEVGPVDDQFAYALLASWREGVWRNAERLAAASSDEERAQVAASIERYALLTAQAIRTLTAADPAARDAWCAAHGGQDPALAPGVGASGRPGASSRRSAARLLVPRTGMRRTGRTVRVLVHCPAPGEACRGELTARRALRSTRILGRTTYAIPVGSTRTLTIRLRRGAVRAISRDRGRMLLRLQRAGAARGRGVVVRTVRVR